MSETKDERYYDFDGLAEGDLSDGLQSGRIFTRFKDKSIAVNGWIDDLISNGYRSGKKKTRRNAEVEEGFFLSDEMQELGVLSIAPALSALLFEVTLLKNPDETEEGEVSFQDALKEAKVTLSAFNENTDAEDKKQRRPLIDVIVKSIGKLLAECFPNGLKRRRNIVLSSMPFYDDSYATDGNGWNRGGYLDTASWVFLAADSVENFLNRLQKVVPETYDKLKWQISITGDDGEEIEETPTTDEVKQAIRDLYLNCIQVTCDCIIKDGDKVRGWSFRHMEEGAEPSLYFSYVASTVYLGLFKRFDNGEGIIDKLRGFEERYANTKSRRDKFYEGLTTEKGLKTQIESLKRIGMDDFAKFLSELSPERLAELDLLYNKINKGQPLTYKINDGEEGSFSKLKNACISFSETLWTEGFGSGKNKTPFKVNMAKGPCFEDGTIVDMDIVRLSGHNNAFFNNLFVIGIILNSAYDVELQKASEEEYNTMLNAFQLSIQNTQRCYNEIANEKLLYKIDSYILDFSEKTDEDNVELAKQLRKVNIAAVPLLPLMLKNNNLMSQYVVRYPQKQMKDSLRDIISNKKRKGNRSSWVWDKDGYNAITNYYYIDALISFYRYYEAYELPFIASEEDKKRIEQEAIKAEKEKYEKQLATKEAEHDAEIREKDAYINRTRAFFKQFAGFIINGLIDVVDDKLTEEEMIGDLTDNEKTKKEIIINQLNSFDKETDDVKITKLMHLNEKLQILSMLAMQESGRFENFFKNSLGEGAKTSHLSLLRNVFGEDGDSSQFMFNIISYLANRSVVPNNGGNDKNNKE